MTDVAAAAGVSQSTVSRILNRKPGAIPASRETRERVERAARELGYRPHPFARALHGAPTMLLGAVVRDITDPFFAEAIEALTIECSKRGYSVVLGHARTTADEALALAGVLEARQCDAIVLVGDFRGERRLVADLRQAPVPVVALWHGSERHDRPFPTVTVDSRAGIRAALTHLTALGHERIAYVGGALRYVILDREEAYREFLSADGVGVPAGYVRHVPNTIRAGALALAELRDLPSPPTAIVAATDVLAIGIINAALAQRIDVPADLSVVGFDDIALAAGTIPSLTTVHMPIEPMVAEGVRIAIGETDWDWAAGNDPPRVVFDPNLIVRDSTAPRR